MIVTLQAEIGLGESQLLIVFRAQNMELVIGWNGGQQKKDESQVGRSGVQSLARSDNVMFQA